jgi:hypothetical protein
MWVRAADLIDVVVFVDGERKAAPIITVNSFWQ